MQRIDLLIVLVLVVAAAGSAVGALTYEDDRLADFRVTWTMQTTELDVPAVSHTGPGDVETSFEVSERNATRLEVAVTIAGAAARLQPTAVRVELLGPNGLSVAEEGELPLGPTASVEIRLALDLAPLPNATSVQAPSLAAARRTLEGLYGSTQGVGEWTVRASLAPGAPGPLGDEAHTMGAVATVMTFEGAAAPETPEVSAR